MDAAYEKLAEDEKNCVLEWKHDENPHKLPMTELVPLAQKLRNAYIAKRKACPQLSDNDIRSVIVNEDLGLEKIRKGYSREPLSVFNVLTDRTRPTFYVQDVFYFMDLRRACEEGTMSEEEVQTRLIERMSMRTEQKGKV